VPHWSDVTVLSWASVEQASTPLRGSRRPLSGVRRPVRTRVGSTVPDTGLTAQCRTVVGMASPGGLAEQRRGMIPRRGADSFLTWVSAGVRTVGVECSPDTN
jgi:hypothetical protein